MRNAVLPMNFLYDIIFAWVSRLCVGTRRSLDETIFHDENRFVDVDVSRRPFEI